MLLCCDARQSLYNITKKFPAGYSGTFILIDHFSNPRNMDELPECDTDGYACIENPGCGDEIKLWLTVQGGLSNIAFKSFVCSGAIVRSSMLSVLAAGKVIKDAKFITDDDVVNAPGGIPENKKHCGLPVSRLRCVENALYKGRGRRSGRISPL